MAETWGDTPASASVASPDPKAPRLAVPGPAQPSTIQVSSWANPDTAAGLGLSHDLASATEAARSSQRRQLHYHCSSAVEIGASLGYYGGSVRTAAMDFAVTFVGSADKPSIRIVSKPSSAPIKAAPACVSQPPEEGGKQTPCLPNGNAVEDCLTAPPAEKARSSGQSTPSSASAGPPGDLPTCHV